MYVRDGLAVKNETRTSRVDKSTGAAVQETLPVEQPNCALLANLLYTEGKPGQVDVLLNIPILFLHKFIS